MTAARLALRSLARHPVRLAASVAGIALALTLTLALDAIYTGVANGLTAYIDHTGADVWVSQAGVRNLHMVASWLPDTVVDQVRAIPGVTDATPILYSTDTVAAGDDRGVAYVIGLPPGAPVGGPWSVVDGTGQPTAGGVVVDAAFARRAGVTVGGQATVMGRSARIVGLTEGTGSLVNSVAFVPFADFRAARGGAPVVSFVLVRVAPGAAPEAVASAIEAKVPGVTAMTGSAFSAGERRLVMDMSADVIAIMDGIGFIVALVVVALTLYIAVHGSRHELAVLKAIGARNRVLYATVLAQSAVSVAAGVAVAVGITAALAVVVPRTGVALEPALTLASVARTAAVGGAVALIAGVLPIRDVAHVDPLTAFRRGGAPA